MEDQPMQEKKSNKTILIAVIIVVVIGAAIAVYFTTQGEDENTNANTVVTNDTVINTTTNTATINTNTAVANLNSSTTTNTNTTNTAQEQDTNELSGSEKQEFIRQVVEIATSEMTFPTEVDQVTTATGIVATPTAVRYEYTLHDIDESLLSDELLKDNAVPSLCQTSETRNDILDRGINMEYSYQVENSTQTYFFSVSKEDCI
ncbi:hypothetical protein ACFL0L_05145 [Patescibacteria group bacterium]